MEALRLVTEGCHDQVGNLRTSNSATRDNGPTPSDWLDGFRCPSKEALMALLWALRVEERKLKSKVAASGPGPSGILPTDNCSVKLVPGGSGGGSFHFRGLDEKKRQRLG